MVRQARAARSAAPATTDPFVTLVRHVTTDTPVDHAPLATTVRFVTTAAHAPFVMTALLVQIAPTVRLETNMRSAMAVRFVKAATWMRRASSTVPFGRPEMNDVTYVPLVMIDRLVMTVQLVMTVPLVMTGLLVAHAQRVTTVHRARIATTGRSVPLVTIVRHVTTGIRVMTAVLHVTTAPLAPIASRVMTGRHETTVPPAAIPTSTPRATRRRSTSPAKTSSSSVFRRWPPRPTTSMV